MPLLLLVRHAENDYTRKGRLAGRLPAVHLNQKGREQANALAMTLDKAPLKAIYSSPLERAVETAEPIAKAHQLEVIHHEGLMELDYGDWQGKSLKGLRRLRSWQTVQYLPSLMCFPQGERIVAAQYRIVRALHEIAAQHSEGDWVLCVSHADPIKLAIAHFLGMPLDTYQRLSIGLASISILYLNHQSARLLTINCSPNLFEGLEKK
ncbi:MAG: histidine phosphatase family protein [Anaerolineales bacterium]